MRILAIGDIVGQRAVEKLEKELLEVKKNENIDFVIANGENAANGNGITKDLFERVLRSGVDVVTMGNHTWGNEEIYEFIEDKRIVRPANVSKGRPGKGYTVIEKNGQKILVMNLIGRKYMEGIYYSDNPFIAAQEIIKLTEEIPIKVIDFHAECTGEKFMMTYFLDGQVSAVYGTHTHVQTADETIMPKGTGFITDIGMTGPCCSELGTIPENGLKRYLDDLNVEDIISDNPIMINGCIFEIDENTGKTNSIRRVQIN